MSFVFRVHETRREQQTKNVHGWPLHIDIGELVTSVPIRESLSSVSFFFVHHFMIRKGGLVGRKTAASEKREKNVVENDASYK